MPKTKRPTSSEASQLIQAFLSDNPEIGGVKGLADQLSISYELMQKYVKGRVAPPLTKWLRIQAVINAVSPTDSKRDPLFNPPEDTNLPSPRDTARKLDSTSGPLSALNEALTELEEMVPDENDLTRDELDWSKPEERQEFFLPVHNFTWFYPEELAVIDHPAFQRLAGMNQLGMAHLVFRGATHRRIEHALGAVGIAQRMLEAVRHNCLKRNLVKTDPKDQWLLGHPPTRFERRFARLATLLHDIGHVPFGHTIEDELRLLNKHDEEKRVNRILDNTTWHGAEVGSLAQLINDRYARYRPSTITEMPAELLKAIILKPSKSLSETALEELRIKEQAWAESGLRVRICRDIVGDTVCADLLDYLHRDWYHVGKPRYFDERILHYMEIRTPKANRGYSIAKFPQPRADDVFVISIGNRPKLRTDGVSAILGLLESRYELAEAVLFHRTKMNATAMLERALSLAIPSSAVAKDSAAAPSARPSPVGDESPLTESTTDGSKQQADLEGWLIGNPEDALLPALLKGEGPIPRDELSSGNRKNWNYATSLISRLLRRDLYDLLLMVTYDELEVRDADFIQHKYGNDKDAANNRAKALRLLEKDFGLETGSIVMYCPESRMNSKIAEVQLFVENIVSRFDKYEEEHKNALSAGHLSAQLERFKSLWKVGFFIAPEVAKEKGEEFLSQLREAIRVLVLNWYHRDEHVETLSARIVRNLVLIENCHVYGKQALTAPSKIGAAREDPVIWELYPTDARVLRDYITTEPDSDGYGSTSADSGKGSRRA